MAREVRLSGVDRGRVMPDAFPSPRVRFHVPSRARVEQTVAQPAPSRENDNLREARGILYSAMLGGGLWVLIGFIAWFIAR